MSLAPFCGMPTQVEGVKGTGLGAVFTRRGRKFHFTQEILESRVTFKCSRGPGGVSGELALGEGQRKQASSLRL